MVLLIIYNIYKLYKIIFYIKDKELPEFINKIYSHKWNIFRLWVESLEALDIYLKDLAPRYNERQNYALFITLVIGKFLVKYKTLTEYKVVNIAPIVAIKYTTIPLK